MTTVSDTEIFRLANELLGHIDIDFAGYSGGGIHVVGGKESIDKVKDAVHLADTIPQYRAEIVRLSDEQKLLLDEKVRLINELTAMEVAAKSRMDLEAMVRRYGISHVLIGLSCIAHEEGQIQKANNDKGAVPEHWKAFGNLLERIARNYSDMEVKTL